MIESNRGETALSRSMQSFDLCQRLCHLASTVDEELRDRANGTIFQPDCRNRPRVLWQLDRQDFQRLAIFLDKLQDGW